MKELFDAVNNVVACFGGVVLLMLLYAVTASYFGQPIAIAVVALTLAVLAVVFVADWLADRRKQRAFESFGSAQFVLLQNQQITKDQLIETLMNKLIELKGVSPTEARTAVDKMLNEVAKFPSMRSRLDN